MAINNVMLCRGRMEGGCRYKKYSSGGHRSEGWGTKQNSSSISLS